MRVAVYYSNRDVRLEEMPIPKISQDELLLKVMASGICGSDVMEWYRIKKAPLVLGHEVTGEVAKVGKNVKKFRKGDRVFVTHHVPCYSCRYCKSGHHTVCDTLRATNFYPGGFAEYIRVPRINIEQGVYELPGKVSFEEGTFIEPLGCVVRGQRIAGVGKEQSVLVVGSGISGILHIQLAMAKGVEKVIATDINQFRLDMARKLGADATLSEKEDGPSMVRKLNDDRLADTVILCTGARSAFQRALQSVERGGTVLLFAPTDPGVEIPANFNDLWMRGITLTTSYAAAACDLKEALELIRTRKVKVKEMVTHRLGLAETGLGFQLVANAKDSLKVIIEPWR